jgi:DNA topoisomerase-2
VKEYTDHCTDVAVKFDVRLLAPVESFEKTMKLVLTKSTNNMHMFSANFKLLKYADVGSVVEEFVGVRRALYAKRKAWLQKDLAALLKRATNKVRYIQGVLSGAIEMRGLTKDAIVDLLKRSDLEELDGDYTYLLHLPMVSVSNEKVEAITQEMQELAEKARVLEGTTVEQMWLRDLTELREALVAPAPSKKRPHP